MHCRFPGELTLDQQHNRNINHAIKQYSCKSKPTYPYPHQRRLVRRRLQYSPQLHRHWLHANRHSHLQHYGPSPRLILRLGDFGTPALQGQGQIRRGTVLPWEMGKTH